MGWPAPRLELAPAEPRPSWGERCGRSDSPARNAAPFCSAPSRGRGPSWTGLRRGREVPPSPVESPACHPGGQQLWPPSFWVVGGRPGARLQGRASILGTGRRMSKGGASEDAGAAWSAEWAPYRGVGLSTAGWRGDLEVQVKRRGLDPAVRGDRGAQSCHPHLPSRPGFTGGVFRRRSVASSSLGFLVCRTAVAMLQAAAGGCARRSSQGPV